MNTTYDAFGTTIASNGTTTNPFCLQENKGMTLLVSITFDPDICGLRTGDSHLVTHLKESP